MKSDVIYLRPGEDDITLTTYISNDEPELKMPPRPAIVVIPGGGYRFTSDREAEPIAKMFIAAGFQAFILRYSVQKKALFPRPLVEASRAVVHVRENAEAYNVDPDKVFVIGFSAGGHLAASLGTLWHKDFAKASPDMKPGMNRPTGMILSYPVITSGPFAHRGSFNNILGEKATDEEALRAYSLEWQVDENTVPTYIWHTTTDTTVPVENTLMFMQALAAHKIPFEAHIFPKGPHGLSLANEQTGCGNPALIVPDVAQWIYEAIDWTKRV